MLLRLTYVLEILAAVVPPFFWWLLLYTFLVYVLVVYFDVVTNGIWLGRYECYTGWN